VRGGGRGRGRGVVEGGLRGGIEVHEAVVLGSVDKVVGRGVALQEERRLADWAEQRERGRRMGPKAQGGVPFAMCWGREEKGDDVVTVVVEVTAAWCEGMMTMVLGRCSQAGERSRAAIW